MCAQGPVCAGRGPGLGEAAALSEAAAQRDNAARSHCRFAALQMGMLNRTYLTFFYHEIVTPSFVCLYKSFHSLFLACGIFMLSYCFVPVYLSYA